MGPAARALVEQYGIDPTKIQGTGPHGVLMKRYFINSFRTTNMIVRVLIMNCFQAMFKLLSNKIVYK